MNLDRFHIHGYNVMGSWRCEITVTEKDAEEQDHTWLLLRTECSPPPSEDTADSVDMLLHTLLRALGDTDTGRRATRRPDLRGV